MLNKGIRRVFLLILAVVMLIMLASCGNKPATDNKGDTEENSTPINDQTDAPTVPEGSDKETEDGQQAPFDQQAEKNGSVIILYTSDVHCAVNEGFGYIGLAAVRDSFEKKGYETILVDNGDAVQGDVLGTLTEGESVIGLMNDLQYDVAIPGNHEFDYGMEQFLKLADMAEFPYISCNFNRHGELVFSPYIIIEAAGIKIAFVGVTTPKTLVTSTPKFFTDDNGELSYGFLEDDTGEKLYNAVQEAVDSARGEGADYVYVLGHLGLLEDHSPWTYADVISNTSGIDVLLDGHSHDTEQIVMKNKEGKEVTRSACGTKLSGIGYSIITPDGITKTGIWNWTNEPAAYDLLGIENGISERIEEAMSDLNDRINSVVAHTAVELTINDPVEKDSNGNPVRMIRRAETNLGDLCTDALRATTGADIGLLNGGGIRKTIQQGDITFGDIIGVMPYGNELCLIEVTGQQIIDALEWGARSIPGENGGFIQVSGLSYEVDLSVESSCESDAEGMFAGISGNYRVKNVRVGDEPIDPERMYTVASTDYLLLNNGDGHTAFKGANVISEGINIDHKALIDFISETLGGVVGEDYEDPYGQGRITIVSAD